MLAHSSYVTSNIWLSIEPTYRTVLLLVNMLVEYCQCVDDTPMLVTDIMNKLFETLKVRFQIPPLKVVEQGCHSGESARIPPMWLGFDSRPVLYVG